ncbi:enoyl-ACP reductase FabI [Nitrincola nitratireducens]|uniref:Enoyl-[acyl-carrier-protein] reductase [NADH] n=1 Tax=Nitrincola nitratireducens TaxID=1229521 RepID=W9UVS2_9GAMM|nr:enoyl-ACP reductase FabI [Nitrincola nitratireducens]EXJ11313.1 Enoyl-[acyl-carrier-protein] reductase [NADH] FabI [Nitrincola nitratireducens]
MNSYVTPPFLSLAGKKGLITGIANDKSIAYAVAKAIVELGGEIIITYQNEKTAQYTRPLAAALGATDFLKLDVTEPESLETVVAKCRDAFGEIDFAIHSMAFCKADDLHGRVIDSSEDGFNLAMNISCHSFLRMGKALEPLMAHGGALITMSYLGAERVVHDYGVMGIVKAALESSVRYMAYDLGPKGIRVFAVSPGPIMTRAASGISNFSHLLEADAHKAPLGRTVTIDEVGALTAFLCAKGSSGMTGQTIYVDAGAHIIA